MGRLTCQIASLEKELKELKAKAPKEDGDDQSGGMMNSGLGQRLMIGGPTLVDPPNLAL